MLCYGKILLAAGAAVDRVNNYGYTALMNAASNRRSQIAEVRSLI